MSLPDSIQRFQRYLLTERRYSALTAETYGRDLGQFADYMTGRWPELLPPDQQKTFDPAVVRHSDVRGWVMLLTERKTATRSINRKITTLRSFYRYLLREKIVEKNPVERIRPLKTGTQLPHFVEQTKMRQLVSLLEEPTDNYSDERDALILILLYSCGLRRSELSGLQVSDIDLGQNTVRVFGKGNKERLLPLLPEVSQRLIHYFAVRKEQNICENDANCLFLTDSGKGLTPQGIYRIVRRLLGLCGLQGKKSPHVLRHTFATHLMQNGASIRTVQQLLGHASLAATQIYTHNTIEKLKEVYREAHPRACDK